MKNKELFDKTIYFNSSYESGKKDIQLEKLYEIAEILGITILDFLP